jgi:ABC-type glycerol-3-phosphate transport system substrate-binding protein
MQDSIAEPPPMRTAALIALGLLAGALLSACSSTGDSQLTFFADPGTYDYHSCDQIAAIRNHWSKREQELKELMAKAEQSTGGAVINVIAYQSDYVHAKEQLQVLAAAARAKNCATPENWRSNSTFR